MRNDCNTLSHLLAASAVTAPHLPGIVGAARPTMARTATVIVAAALVAGCATGPDRDPRDPIEPLNRTIYEINDRVDRAVLKPVAEVYVAVLPTPAQDGVSNFFGNIYDFWNAVNNLLQGKVGTAFSDVGRIALNTTVGLLGVVDVASRVGLQKSDEDFGQTLGWWGLPHGPYLVLPLIGPSSLRDGSASIVQFVYDPITLGVDDEATMWSLWGLRVISVRARLLGAGRIFDTASADPYATLRDAYFQRRRSQLWDGNPPREKDFYSTVPPSVVQLQSVWSRAPALETPVASPDEPVPASTPGATSRSVSTPHATGGAEFTPAILARRTTSD